MQRTANRLFFIVLKGLDVKDCSFGECLGTLFLTRHSLFTWISHISLALSGEPFFVSVKTPLLCIVVFNKICRISAFHGLSGIITHYD